MVNLKHDKNQLFNGWKFLFVKLFTTHFTCVEHNSLDRLFSPLPTLKLKKVSKSTLPYILHKNCKVCVWHVFKLLEKTGENLYDANNGILLSVMWYDVWPSAQKRVWVRANSSVKRCDLQIRLKEQINITQSSAGISLKSVSFIERKCAKFIERVSRIYIS